MADTDDEIECYDEDIGAKMDARQEQWQAGRVKIWHEHYQQK